MPALSAVLAMPAAASTASPKCPGSRLDVKRERLPHRAGSDRGGVLTVLQSVPVQKGNPKFHDFRTIEPPAARRYSQTVIGISGDMLLERFPSESPYW